jgi:hypothetical protein
MCFGTDGGDACGCHFPLEDVEVFFPVIARVLGETLVLLDLAAAMLFIVTLLGASSWSLGVQG